MEQQGTWSSFIKFLCCLHKKGINVKSKVLLSVFDPLAKIKGLFCPFFLLPPSLCASIVIIGRFFWFHVGNLISFGAHYEWILILILILLFVFFKSLKWNYVQWNLVKPAWILQPSCTCQSHNFRLYTHRSLHLHSKLYSVSSNLHLFAEIHLTSGH